MGGFFSIGARVVIFSVVFGRLTLCQPFPCSRCFPTGTRIALHADAGYRSALTSKTLSAASDHAASIWGISTGDTSLLCNWIDPTQRILCRESQTPTTQFPRSFTSYLRLQTGPELLTSCCIAGIISPNKYINNTMGDMISSLLFQPPPPTYIHPSRHFRLDTSYGTRIPAFFIERPNAQVTILFSHGNAEDLGMIYDWFNDLARVLRVNIMAYGESLCLCMPFVSLHLRMCSLIDQCISHLTC